MARPPLVTSISLPPMQLVSPVESPTPGLGSPTPTPGTAQKQHFWDNAARPSRNNSKSRSAAGTPTPAEPKPIRHDPQASHTPKIRSPAATPNGEARRVFWDVSQKKRPSRSQAGSPTPTEKKHTFWSVGSKTTTDPKTKGHKVSFSDSSNESDRSKTSEKSKRSSRDPESSQSDTSRPSSPVRQRAKSPMTASSVGEELATRARVIQLVDKRAEAVSREISPPPAPREPPFVAYTDSFLELLGPNPQLEQILHDQRAPYWGGSGCFHRATQTLFVTSSFNPNPAPDAAPSKNLSITMTSVAFYSGSDITRDKVRFAENHMPGGSCVWHPPASGPQRTSSGPLSSSLVVCAQGTLNTPAGLLRVAPRRPHTATPLLTNYVGGRPFNSPHSCAALSDGSILFTDPPVGYEIGFRPRPQLPPLVYRFDPATGDVRAVADGLARPTAIAVSPDERTVYVIDAPRPRKLPSKGEMGRKVEDVLDACSAPQPTVQAFSLVGVSAANGGGPGGTGVFLTNRRLFAFPEACPMGLAVNARGDVFVACDTVGVLVFGRDGSMMGRIRMGYGDSVAGACCGRKGEMFAWGGNKIWRIGMEGGRLS